MPGQAQHDARPGCSTALGFFNGRTVAAHAVWVNDARHGDPESARRGHRALPVEQYEAGQRRGAR